jgi:endonuclease YncB( thermonuclease family)
MYLHTHTQARFKTHGKPFAPSPTPCMTVTLREVGSDDDGELNVNGELLRSGLARLARGGTRRARDAIEALRPQLDEARAARRGMFEYGDPDDSEDEGEPRLGRGTARGGR